MQSPFEFCCWSGVASIRAHYDKMFDHFHKNVCRNQKLYCGWLCQASKIAQGRHIFNLLICHLLIFIPWKCIGDSVNNSHPQTSFPMLAHLTMCIFFYNWKRALFRKAVYMLLRGTESVSSPESFTSSFFFFQFFIYNTFECSHFLHVYFPSCTFCRASSQRAAKAHFPQINLGTQPDEWPRRVANVPTLHSSGRDAPPR